MPKTRMDPQFLVAVLGWCLLCFGTLICYSVFFVLRLGDNFGSDEFEGPMPVITDMFREWPLAGSATAGLGSALVCWYQAQSITVDSTWGILAASSSLWLVIGSSENFDSLVISILHSVFTVLFLFSAVYAVYELRNRRWLDPLLLASVAVAFSASGSGLVFVLQEKNQAAKTGLAVSEVLFVVLLSGTFAWHLFFKRLPFTKPKEPMSLVMLFRQACVL